MTATGVHTTSSLSRESALTFALALGMPIVALIGLLLAPGDEQAKLVSILHGICAQRPSHSIASDGQPMALEARMYGIFAGVAFTVVYAWLRGRWRNTELPHGLQLFVLLGFVAAMGIDGLNALYFDTTKAALYAPRTELRLFTGLLCGLSMAAFIAPSVSQALWKETHARPLFESWTDLGLAILLVATVGVASLIHVVPIGLRSIVAVASVFAGFWLVNLHFVVLAWEGVGRHERWAQLRSYATTGFVLTAGELCALSAFRVVSESVLHIPWVI